MAGSSSNWFEGLGWAVQLDNAERLVAAQPVRLAGAAAPSADDLGLTSVQSAQFLEGDEIASLSLAGRGDGTQSGSRPVSYTRKWVPAVSQRVPRLGIAGHRLSTHVPTAR